MSEKDENKWPKHISVDKRIVRILSESTYENFPRALKELVTNSYDADARNVTIDIDLKNETVIVEDDGKGMDETDFSFYIRIAGRKREKDENTTPLGRQIIGQFGVGFLSIFPFFKSYSIETTKAGLATVLHASIPLSKYFSNEYKPIDLDAIIINGGKRDEPSKLSKSYTRIVLSGFNELTKSFFFPPKPKKEEKGSIKSLDGISQVKWYLSEDLPLQFKKEKFNKVFNYSAGVNFNVTVNKTPLYRQEYGDSILETHTGEFLQIGKIKCKYFIATPKKLIQPKQGRYYKLRNLNVGVGEREDFGEDHGEGSHMRWLYGEIHIIEGLNNLIRVSRDGFNFSSDFEELKTIFNSKLRHQSTKLEKSVSFQRNVTQTGKQFRVSNVKLLKPKNFDEKLEDFKKEGYTVKKVEHTSYEAPIPIKVNEETKEIVIEKNTATFEKHIIIGSKKYRVVADEWDYLADAFPACKVHGNVITINEKYPLFSSVKYTDIFVKMHLMFIFSYENGEMTKNTFTHLSNEVLKYYKDYLK